jgi:hypothetical protein
MFQSIRPISALSAISLIFLGSTGAYGDEKGSVTGTVKFTGDPPKKPDLYPTMPGCPTAPLPDPGIVIGQDHGLANAVVYLTGATSDAQPVAHDVTLDQKGCRFIPHVQATTLGSKLTVKNSDSVLHTAHARSASAQTLFNVATPSGLTSQAQALTTKGPIAFTCDAGHTWMSAYIYVSDQPYFTVSDASGAFSISDVPAGAYTLNVWHEKFGERSAKVTVVAGRPASVSVDYKPSTK